MKKNIKGCLSLLLAVALVAGSTLYARDTSLKATNYEITQEDQGVMEETAGSLDADSDDEADAPVEIVLPTEPQSSESEDEVDAPDEETPDAPDENAQQGQGETQTPAAPDENTQQGQGETQTPAAPDENAQQGQGETQTPAAPDENAQQGQGETQSPAAPDENAQQGQGETQSPAAPDENAQQPPEQSQSESQPQILPEIDAVPPIAPPETPEEPQTIPLIPLVPATQPEALPEFDSSTTVGDVTVSLHADEGVLPEGTTVSVRFASKEDALQAIEQETDKHLMDAAAFDITLYDKNGDKIQPSGSVKLKLEGLSIEGDEIGVAHLDDSGRAELLGGLEENTSSIEIEADSFSVYAVYGVAANAPLSDEQVKETITMKSGEWRRLWGTSMTGIHKWEWTSDDGVGSIELVNKQSGKESIVEIRALQAGEVTLKHTCAWIDGTDFKEVYKINILPPSDIPQPEGSQKVYIYVKLQVDDEVNVDDGWVLNEHDWYTIGYMDVQGIPSPAGNPPVTDEIFDKVMAQLSNNRVHYFSGHEAVSSSINLRHDVQWDGEAVIKGENIKFGLKTVDGANHYYPDDKGNNSTWHLDGLVKIDHREEHTVTVHYIYEDGSKAHDSVVKTGLTGSEVIIASPIIKGYKPSRDVIDHVIMHEDRVFTVIYKAINRPVPPAAQIKLVIIADSDSKEYDGTPLTKPTFQHHGALKQGDRIVADMKSSITNVGRVDNVLTNVRIMREDGDQAVDVSSEYDIRLIPGELVITPAPKELVITANSEEWVYDGEEHSDNGFTHQGALKDGDRIEVAVTGSITNAGTAENVLGEIKIMRGDKDVTNEYKIKPQNGILTVKKKTVTFVGISGNRVYNGKEQTITGFETEGLLDGHTSNVQASVSGKEAKEYIGSITQAQDVVIRDQTQQDVTQNYEIKTIPGKLMITEGQAYVLTIHYVDKQGNRVASDFIKSYPQGEQFSITSPNVDGYVPDIATIGSGEDGMPASDLEFWVVYSKIELPDRPSRPTDPDDIDTPEKPRTPVDPSEPEEPESPEVIEVPEEELVDTPVVPQPQPPVDVVITEDENGDYVLRTVEDNKTPLANQDLGDHSCCILHFLLLLLALLVVILHTRSMKKHQEKMFELRETLTMEKLKRGLDIDEQDIQ